ncbi:MAG: nucleotidyltransferase family protein [Oligoflexia bacterium]|nr:nucleotidyltransferase family protein [Oligoflexia bacterium]
MKAIILAGGRGKRLNQYTQDNNKCMLPFEGIPLIEHSLRKIISLPIDEIIIVVGHRAEDIINFYGIHYNGKRIRYVIQRELKGLVHAIECCQQAVGYDDFMLFLGDEIMVNPHHQQMLEYFHCEDVFALCGTVTVEDTSLISKTYAIIYNEINSQIFRLVEKPKKALNNFMGTGNCIFKNEIFNYIGQTPINQTRQEKELPDLIQCAIDDGKVVKAYSVCDRYINVNSEDDIIWINNI